MRSEGYCLDLCVFFSVYDNSSTTGNDTAYERCQEYIIEEGESILLPYSLCHDLCNNIHKCVVSLFT